MYQTSTQKKHWMFDSQEAVDAKRERTLLAFRQKNGQFMPTSNADDPLFLSLKDEKTLLTIVTRTSQRFGDEFCPDMWPSVKWMALAYFKRFFLRHSAMEYSAKDIATTCYYVAAKVEEFNVSIDEFVRNLKTGTPESNRKRVLEHEQTVMMAMDYNLIIHTPYRAFEGHLLEMKSSLVLVGGFRLEEVRQHAMSFFAKAAIGDAMFLYAPSQIALAGLKYGLERELKKPPELLEEFLCKLLTSQQSCSEEDDPIVVKVQMKLDELIDYVIATSIDLTNENISYVKTKYERYTATAITRIPQRVDSDEDSD